MLLLRDCTFITHIAMSLLEILLKFEGELGACLCNLKMNSELDACTYVFNRTRSEICN